MNKPNFSFHIYLFLFMLKECHRFKLYQNSATVGDILEWMYDWMSALGVAICAILF